MTRQLRSKPVRALVAVMVFVPAAVSAAESGVEAGGFQYVLSAGAMHSDNPGRTRIGGGSETALQLGLSANLQYDRGRYTAGLDTDLQYQKHNYRNYGESMSGGVAAHASASMFRDVLVWVVEEDLTQSLIDSRSIVSPENTQDLNVLSSGPDLAFPLGSRTSINVQGRWTDVHYEKSNYGNQRLSASLGLERRIGETSTLSLSGSAVDLKYKELPAASDYDVRTASLTWRTVGSRTKLNMSAGYSNLEEQQGSADGTTFALELIRKASAKSTVELHAGRSFGDSADAAKRDRGIRGVSIGDRPAAISSDPQKADYGTLIWNLASRRSGFTLSADWRREAHLRDDNLNRRVVGGGLALRRTVSPRFGLSFHAEYSTENFADAAIRFEEWGVGLGMNWRFTRTAGLSAGWDRLSARGDSLLGENTRDYDENRLSMNLTWAPER